MPTSFPASPLPPAHRLMRVPRTVFAALASVCIASALPPALQTPWFLGALLFYGLLWPQLAFELSRRSGNVEGAERQLLVADSAWAGAWIAAIGGNLLPSAVVTVMLSMNALALGGRGLLLRGLEAQVCFAAVLWLALGSVWVPQPSAVTVLACMPLLVAYPLLFSWLSRNLAIDFNRKHAEFVQSERLQRETFNAMRAGVVLYDAQDRLVFCNDDFRRLYPTIGHRFEPGQSFREMLEMAVEAGVIRAAKGREKEWIDERVAAHQHPSDPVVRQMANGTWRRIKEQKLPGGGILAFSIDVTELIASKQALAAANAELERISETDALTGLANRRQFDRRLFEECSRAARHHLPLSLILLDVDHFKRLNDVHGHLAGDHCLRQIAQTLAKCAVRATDVVARFGGEEFAILLPHTTQSEAVEVAKRCLQAVDEAEIAHPDSPIGPHVSISLGTATVLAGADKPVPTQLIDEADQALYRAKQMGRHQIQSHRPSPSPDRATAALLEFRRPAAPL